jgi:hypothetical protein
VCAPSVVGSRMDAYPTATHLPDDDTSSRAHLALVDSFGPTGISSALVVGQHD